MRSYSQPEGELVSDAQEGKSEIPPLKRRKKEERGWAEDEAAR